MSTSAVAGRIIPHFFREVYGNQHLAKHVARAADCPYETARGWVKGRTSPSAATLLRMADNCDRLAAALERRISERHAAAASRQISPAVGVGAAMDGQAGEVTR
jgi:hypothetical protein